jgi:hypothetical protein
VLVNIPRVRKSDSYFTPYASNDIDVLLLTQIVVVRFENTIPSPKKEGIGGRSRQRFAA